MMMRISQGIFVSVICGLVGLGACAWGDGSGTSGQGSTGTAPPVCGDGTCETSEVGVCASDCGNSGSGSGSNPSNTGSGSGSGSGSSCGNTVCEANLGEDSTTCPADCTSAGSGSGGALNCNDQNVVLGCFACAIGGSCTPPYDATSCAPCLGTGGGGGCGDGTCDAAAGETNATCPLDCP